MDKEFTLDLNFGICGDGRLKGTQSKEASWSVSIDKCQIGSVNIHGIYIYISFFLKPQTSPRGAAILVHSLPIKNRDKFARDAIDSSVIHTDLVHDVTDT